MKLHEIIRELENDRDNWEDLTGDILATLHVNIERGLLTASDPAKFARWLSGWHMRRSRLQASGADIANVTFTKRQGVSEQEGE